MKKKKLPADFNLRAKSIVDLVTGEDEEEQPTSKSPPQKEEPTKNPAAVALGRLGGLKGGKARAAKMTPKERSESARKAVKARWAKNKE
jgi:hypothetical protein